MLYDDSLARLRALAEQTMTRTCEIRKESKSQGVYGEPTHAETVVAADVPCRLIPAGEQTSSRAQDAGSRETLEEMYRLAVPTGTELGADYRVIVDDVGYLVVQVEQSLSDAVMVQALVVRDNG